MTRQGHSFECFVLASRIIPDLDGGFARAVLLRAQELVGEGIDTTVLTVDPASRADHAAHRAEFVRRGALDDPARMRNLFDEAIADPSWLRAAAHAGERTPGVDYRVIADDDGTAVLELPVIVGDPDWHTTTASIVVHEADGGIAGVLSGFRELYHAWLDQVTGGRRVVILIEARQLGELLVDWDSPARLVHAIHTTHLGAPYTPQAALGPMWERWFDVAAQFDAILWLTAEQRDDVRARFGGGRRDEVVPHGADPVAEPVLAASRPPHRAVMINRLSAGKRLDHAIRVWSGVVARFPDAVLDVYGEGPERARLEDLVAESGLQRAIRFHGHVSDPSEVLDDATVMILTTAFEGQGLVILEALSRATPVISYDVRYGPRESLRHGGGILVPSGDEAAFERAVRAVLGNPAFRAELGAQAYGAAMRLSRAVMTPRLIAVLEDVLLRPRRR